MDLTPEQINREIAEKVMGWHLRWPSGDWLDESDNKTGYSNNPLWLNYFDPYHRIDQAWMAVEKLKQWQYFLILSENPFSKAWKAKFTNIRTPNCDVQEFGDTAPMAICLAALEAVPPDSKEKI